MAIILIVLFCTVSVNLKAAGTDAQKSPITNLDVMENLSLSDVANDNDVQIPQKKLITVTGIVIDENTKEPLAGVSVVVKNQQILALTDIEGKYSINAPSNCTLQFMYIGMETQEIEIKGKEVVNVALKESQLSLDEVIVVGYGTQKKVSVTGAITNVKAPLLKTSATTLSTGFAGRIAGVIASQTSGAPGSGSEFYIRGISTFGGRTTPLILLDDVEISIGDLNYIPTENIESFSILKDASATAIYGARGANGVMIITTKGGDYNSKTAVNVTLENSFNLIDKFPDFVDGSEYMKLYNEASVARGGNPRYTDIEIERTANGYNKYLYPNVNWRDVMFRNMSMRQKANINVSGGGQKVKYFMSLEVNHDSGLLNTKKAYSWNNNINIMNYTFQNNISYKLTPTTTIKMNMNAQIRQSKGPNANPADLFNNILTTTPILFPVTYPTKDGVEHIMYGNDHITGDYTYINPYAQMMTTYKQSNENTLNTVIKLDQDFDFITKGLKFNAWFNFKNWSQMSFTRSINPYFYRKAAGTYDLENPNTEYDLELLNQNGTDYIAQSDISKGSDYTFELQANLNWNRSFDKHNIGVMALYRQREFRSNVLPNRNQGISGRITYDYALKYLFEFNFGYNGTERLSKKDRFGFFPAASVGWVISNEDFFENLSKTITHLKLRGSYGLVGSDDLARPGGSYYLYIDKIADNNLNYLQWTSGQDMNFTLGGPELRYYAQNGLGWEKVKKLDIGLDITLFNDLSLTLDYFLDKRYDIFMQREAWPQSLAYHEAKPWSNVGKMENKGFEGSLNYNKNITDDLNVTLQANVTYNQNKVTYKDEPNYPTTWKMELNKPLNPTWGYIADGLFQSQEEIDNSPKQDLGSIVRVGDIKYRDINGDGRIGDEDRIMISEHNRTPKLQFGFGGTISYKKFDFGIFFNGSAKRTIMTQGMDPFQEGIGVGNRNVIRYIADDYFSEAKGNFDAKYPRLGLKSTDISNNTQSSTYWMRKGDFIRLKNIEIGYKIPKGRIFVTATNLFTISSFDLWDPELASWNSYPLQKVVNLGLQLNF